MYEIGKLMYQFTHKMLPDQFANYFSYSTTNHSYRARHASGDSLYLLRYSRTRTNNRLNTKVLKFGMMFHTLFDIILILNSRRRINYFY